MKREALKMALEALEVANSCVDGYYIPKGKTQLPEVEEAINAIKEALAQPEQEPVAAAWDKGYQQGVQDERTSEANIGIAGFGAKVQPARQNPYGTTTTYTMQALFTAQ